jgi:glutathione S-transferase
MSNVTLTYFPLDARGLTARAALAIAGIEFEDKHIAFADFPAAKPTLPLGQLPILSIDGEQHTQTAAIVRYALARGGKAPTDPLTILRSTELVEIFVELNYKAPQTKDEEEKKRLRQEFAAGKLAQSLAFIDSRIGSYGKQFAVADTVTEADLHLLATVHTLKTGFFDHIPADTTDKYEHITRVFNAVYALPEVQRVLIKKL